MVIFSDQSDPEVKTESKDEPYTRCFEQPFKRFSYALQSTWRSDARFDITKNGQGNEIHCLANGDKVTIDSLSI